MRKYLFIFLISAMSVSSFALTKQEAEKKMTSYFADTKNYTLSVCENERYFIGEFYIKGYEGISLVRKVYVNKNNGDIIPEMAQSSDYCYMLR